MYIMIYNMNIINRYIIRARSAGNDLGHFYEVINGHRNLLTMPLQDYTRKKIQARDVIIISDEEMESIPIQAST